jgi:DNA-binding NarL/FixJ family response regulator
MNKCRVMIVDDVKQVREDLRTLLSLSDRIEIVGEAQNGIEAVENVQLLHPDIVLMDLEMPVLDGYETTSRIKSIQPATRVIILSIHYGAAEREHARSAGADGFLAKGSSYEVLVNVILESIKSPNNHNIEKGAKP